LNNERRRSGGYDPSYFAELAKAEDRHFWFVCRNELIGRIAARACGAFGPGSLVLEAGCGTGNVLRYIETACPNSTVIGMDMWNEGLGFARERTSAPLLVANIADPPFSRRFDMICLFDVLEHIEDDCRVLEQVYSLLSPGGIVLLTVPACPSLWSYFDEAAQHCRRYTASELGTKMLHAGFNIAYLTAFMAALFPLVWAGRRGAGLRKQKTVQDRALREFKVVPGFNGVMSWVLRLENSWLLQGHKLSVGTSLLAVGQRPLP
jgi:SAM-dependent methyltransferase